MNDLEKENNTLKEENQRLKKILDYILCICKDHPLLTPHGRLMANAVTSAIKNQK